jgi:L-Ala-D/L-Glu epimerase / N-acetyl-D-glutamate racemase
MSRPALSVRIERWPVAGSFAISRGSKTEAIVVVAEVSQGVFRGRGEAVPYRRYGETIEGVAAALESMTAEVGRGLDPFTLQDRMPAGAARNALDCALWDLAAKRSGRPAHELLNEAAPKPLTTAYTISFAAPQEMAQRAARVAGRALLKVKLGGAGDAARVAAVRCAAPHAQLIADVNEGWTPGDIEQNLAACAQAGVTLVEQPLPAAHDDALAAIKRSILVCADESAHTRASLASLVGKYDAVNIKLDKAGGLTEALAMAREAEQLGFAVMAGCMVATSLAMAPAMLVAQHARVVDLDGPLLLARAPRGCAMQTASFTRQRRYCGAERRVGTAATVRICNPYRNVAGSYSLLRRL